MHPKHIGIIASIIIGIAIIGTITIDQNPVQDNIEKHAVDSKTLEVLMQNKEHVLVIDIRTAEQYQLGHIEGAAHDTLDSATFEKRVKTIQNRLPDVVSNYNLVLVDDNGSQSKQMSQTMIEMGIQTFYLDGGMNSISENVISGHQTVIDSQDLMERMVSNEDLYLLDVREPDELLESKIDGAVNIPLAKIFQPNGIDSIPTDKPVVVICASGNRATIATYALAQEGVEFQVLEGGMNTWTSQIKSEM